VEGIYTCSTEYYVDGIDLGTQTDQKNLSYTLPTGETSYPGYWGDSPWTTAHYWNVGLTSSKNLGGRVVAESDGGSEVDTCWYTGSPVAKVTSIPNTSTTVGSDNSYYDKVGWREDAVACYRAIGTGCFVYAYDCQFEATQNMSINVPGSSNYQYKTNRLKAGINQSSVWSERDGHDQSINR
jgi:hypothetical protein